MKKILFFFAVLSIMAKFSDAQVAISDDVAYTPNSSALLDIHSKDGDMGLLIPQVELVSETSASPISNPANGLLVYNSGTNLNPGYYFWSSSESKWKMLYSGYVPSIAGNVEYWIRPTDETYICPEYNSQARVYDSGKNWGYYYEGSNKHGAFFAGDDVGVIGQRAGTDTSVVPTFYDDEFPFYDINNDQNITSDDRITVTGIYGFGNYYIGVTGIANSDAGVRGIAMADGVYGGGTNSSWPVVGVMGEVIEDGSGYYGQQAVYGWQAASHGAGDYCIGVIGRTSQTGSYSGGVAGFYTSSVGDLTTCFTAPDTYGMLGRNFAGVYGRAVGSTTGTYGGYFSGGEYAGYFNGDVKVVGDMYADNYYNKSGTMFYGKATANIIEDFGTGQLKYGKAKIEINNSLLDLAEKNIDYRVYVQMTDENSNGVYVKKYKDYFEVIENNNGKSNATFDWRLVIVKETKKKVIKEIHDPIKLIDTEQIIPKQE